MRVSFHGVRGSHSVCGARYLKFGGCTASVSIEAAGWRILLDLGTGLIAPGKIWASEKNGSPPARPLIALVSHPHRDHLAGFAFFKPAYRAGWKLELYGPKLRNIEFGEMITRSMAVPFFPVEFDELKASITTGSFATAQSLLLHADGARRWGDYGAAAPAGGVKITALHNPNHPKDGVMNYAIECGGKRLIYATDTESTADAAAPLCDFAQGADLLIHDAQYTPAEYHHDDDPTRGYGHSTHEMACAVAVRSAVKSLLLFHHDPDHGDAELESIETQAAAHFPGTRLAYEGMVVEI